MEVLINKLYDINCIKFGQFKLKNKSISPFNIDLRILVSYPLVLNKIAVLLWEKIKDLNFNLIAGLAYGGLPITCAISNKYNIPMILVRKEVKDYSTRKIIEGVYDEESKCIIIDDVMTTGNSLKKYSTILSKKIKIEQTIVICNRSINNNSNIIQLFSIYDIISILLKNGKISNNDYNRSLDFIYQNHNKINQLSFENRIKLSYNSVQTRLYNIIITKKTNLILSLDLTDKTEILKLITQVGCYICILKLHIDIIRYVDNKFIDNLKSLSKKFNFLLFEDHKYSDIGNTFRLQYTNSYKVNLWADIISVHCISGEGIMEEFIKLSPNKAILLIAEMSSKDNLIDRNYTKKVIDIANKYKNNVLGFICQHKISEDNSFIYITPGISLNRYNDTKDQTYKHPNDVIIDNNSDLIIVGRDIYNNPNPKIIAEKISRLAWNLYEFKIKIKK